MDLAVLVEKTAVFLKNGVQRHLHKILSDRLAMGGAVVLLSLLAVGVFAVVLTLSPDEGLLSGNVISRPQQGAAQEIEVVVQDEQGGKEYPLHLTIGQRELTEKEILDHFEKADLYLLERLALDNESLSKVSGNLYMPAAIEELRISIDWYSDHYDLINYDGSVEADKAEQNGTKVCLTAVMQCGDKQAVYEYPVTVVPPTLSSGEAAEQAVNDSVADAVEQNRYEEKIVLPEKIGGNPVRYFEPRESPFGMAAAIGAAVAVLLAASVNNSRRTKEEKRRRQLQYDYSEVVSKLTMLIGAGMSVQKAWNKIALDYNQKRKTGKEMHFAYEEMWVTYCQMQTGASERLAYTEFGRRCGVKEYRKLGTLLEQNVRKGTKGLSMLLEQESIESFEQRKNMARQLGEEAGTKLLLPMILMLVIVMVIVMVPAVMSFQI